MIRRYVRPSEIKLFKRCRRSWMLQYVRNLERIRYDDESDTARTGNEVHRMLEAYYRQGITAPDSADELANIIVEGYFEWVAETGADVGLRTVYAETRIEVPFGVIHGDEIVLTAKPDRVVFDEATGLYLLHDHKTVQSLEQAGQQLKVDDQLLTYTWMLRELGIRADGALHNMLRRVKRSARATPPFYERLEVRHNVHEMRSYWMRLWGETIEILRVYRELDSGSDPRAVAYPNPTKDCSWKCDFFAVCPMFDDGSAAERMVDDYFIAGDPLARYQEEEPRED